MENNFKQKRHRTKQTSLKSGNYMKKLQYNFKVWAKAGNRIDEAEARKHFKDPLRIPISVGYRNLDGRWVEVQCDYAWTSASAPGATIIPALTA